MTTRYAPLVGVLAVFLSLAACDNIGRAFDLNGGTGSGSGADATGIQAIAPGGDARDGRPSVREVFPSGSGFPASTPIVVVFSESLNSATVLPESQGADGGVTVQLQGSGQAVPASYELLDGNRVLLIRPTGLVPGVSGEPFEVIVDPEVRDADGIRYGGTEGDVVGEFFVDQDSEFADGAVLTVLPVDNGDAVDPRSNVYIVFDKAPDPMSVNTSTVRLQTAAGVVVSGDLRFPFGTLGQSDNRVLEFDPGADLDPNTQYQIVFTTGITFPDDGILNFRGRTPFARFETLGFAAPTAVRVGNPATGFDNKVNRGNLESLIVDVETPATVAAGDRLLVRLYGLDRRTSAEGDVNFVERTASVPAAGVQTVSVPFAEVTGTLAEPRFEDGTVLMAAQLQRGGQHSGFVQSDATTSPRLDLVPPNLDSVGPPGVDGTNDIVTDQDAVAFFGVASEEIGGAELTDATTTVNPYAASGNGPFIMASLQLGRRSTPLDYSINLTDRSGNVSAQAFTGRILQRGVVTGALAGTLTVEAYDRSTLSVIEGATVLLDPAVPTVPAAGQVSAMTDASGRAVFTGVAGRYTVTIVRTGYDLVTLTDAESAFVSLPLEPIANGAAMLTGTVNFQTAPGATVRVGSNLLADRSVLDVATTAAAPTEIPTVDVLPNRPQVVTAFASSFEPSQTPAFSFFACQMCGVDGITATPPSRPATGGQSRPVTLTLAPPLTGTTGDLAAPYTVDLAGGGGFDAANLDGNPIARLTAGLSGFGGQTLMGVGVATLSAGTTWRVDGTLALSPVAGLASFVPTIWSVLQAQDTTGNVVRHRALVIATTRAVLNLAPAPGIATITGGGTFTTAPAIPYEDRLARTAIVGGQAMLGITCTDAAGRQWQVFREDLDGATGAQVLQLPDVSAAGDGLAAGTWTVVSEAWLSFSLAAGPGSFILEDRLRSEVTYARSASASITVN